MLEAAERCVARDGLAQLGIAGVAAEAGVSRPTVYRYFQDRRELIQATLMRSGEALSSRVADHLSGFDDPGAMALETVRLSLRATQRDPLLRQVWTNASLDASALAGFTQPFAIALTERAIRPLADAAGWSARESTEASETLMRFVLSLLAAPGPSRSDAALRGYLRRRLLPALGL
ncbi:MAG: helix-turn-helix domain-containing protein [Myxococcota bacterium]